MSESGNITKQLKELIAEFVSADGIILESPTGRYYGRKQLDDRRLKLLRILVEVLLNTRFLREATKYYIKSQYMSIQGVAAHMQYIGKEINPSTVQSIIWTDMERFNAKLSKRILVDIVEYNQDIDIYEWKILRKLAHYSNGHLFRNLALKLPEPVMTIEASEEEFQDFVQMIAPYSPRHIAYLGENVSAEMLGYAKYITSSTLLSGEEQERKELLLNLLYKEE